MALRSGLFDSTEVVETISGFPRGNKAETADFFAAYFASFIASGIYISPATNFAVMSQSGMTVQIRPGKCFIRGYFALDDSAETHTFTSDAAAHEYWLCLRLDTADGSISKTWVTDPASGALPVRTDTVYDLVIATVAVPGSATTISDAMITDRRADTAYCGYVRSLVDGIGANVSYADTAGALSALLGLTRGGTGASTAAGARTNLGLGDAATKSVGTAADNVAAGDHLHDARYLKLAGGTLTGALTLSGDPSAALSAATKRYVDNSAVTLVELARYTSSGTFSPADYPSVDNRYLILLVGGGNSGGSGYAAGAAQFVDFLWLPTLMPQSFTAIVAAVNGTTKFVADASGGAFLAPGSTHTGSTGTVSPGSTGSYTGASGSASVGGFITGYGGSGQKGIVIIYGYRKVGDIA